MTSNNTAVVILAAGQARRMHGVKKQLLRLGKYTVIGRTIAQVKKRKLDPYVISNDEEILASSDNWYKPLKSSVTCETLLSTSPLWRYRNIVLLGDVIYSPAAMDSIFECDDNVRVFGDTWEVFAISFNYKSRHKVTRALEKTIPYQNGKLRFFYRAFMHYPMDMKETEGEPPEGKVFYYIHDWTRDIDLPDEFKYAVLELVNTGIINKL